MTDYGRPITFGLSLDPGVDRLEETRRLATSAAAGGLDYLAVQDHPYQPGHLDAWTLITGSGATHLDGVAVRIGASDRPRPVAARGWPNGGSGPAWASGATRDEPLLAGGLY
jgi:hypothetical protein